MNRNVFFGPAPVDANGDASDIAFDSGSRLSRGAVKTAVSRNESEAYQGALTRLPRLQYAQLALLKRMKTWPMTRSGRRPAL